MAQAQLPQSGDHRHHVIDIEQAVGNQLIGMLHAVLFPHHHSARLQVHLLGQIVRLG